MSGGGVLIDWGVHFIDLIMYVLNNPNIISVSGKAFCKLGKNMKEYVYKNMWAGPPDYNGVYNVDDSVTAFVRTSGSTITLNGAWAQNILDEDMTIEFLGSKGGVKLRYRNDFDLTTCKNGSIITEKQICEPVDAFAAEIDSFIESVITRKKNRANIDNVIVSQLIIDSIYESSENNREIIIQSY